MLTGLNDPRFWELRAEAARMLATEMSDDFGKATMVRIAESYDSLAAHALLKAKTVSAPASEPSYVELNPNVTKLQKAR